MAVAPYGLQCFDVPRFIFFALYTINYLFAYITSLLIFLLLISFLIYF